MNVIQRVLWHFPSLRAKVTFRRNRNSVVRVKLCEPGAPCAPNERFRLRHDSHESALWLLPVLRVFEAAAKAGEAYDVGEEYVFEIPHRMIPRKHPGFFAWCITEGGYEVGLSPLECEIRSHNRRRSGTLTVRKCW